MWRGFVVSMLQKEITHFCNLSYLTPIVAATATDKHNHIRWNHKTQIILILLLISQRALNLQAYIGQIQLELKEKEVIDNSKKQTSLESDI